MTKKELLKAQKEYYDNVYSWFMAELKKLSEKHKIHLSDYAGILSMWRIGSDEEYEPYRPHAEYREEYAEALQEYEKLIKDLGELGVKFWQGLEYSDKSKFIHF